MRVVSGFEVQEIPNTSGSHSAAQFTLAPAATPLVLLPGAQGHISLRLTLGALRQVENYRAHARPSAPLPASINSAPQSPIRIAAT